LSADDRRNRQHRHDPRRRARQHDRHQCGTGLWARSLAGAITGVYVINSAIVENATSGVSADGANTTIALMGSAIIGNSVGISAPSGGKLLSYKNNAINFTSRATVRCRRQYPAAELRLIRASAQKRNPAEAGLETKRSFELPAD